MTNASIVTAVFVDRFDPGLVPTHRSSDRPEAIHPSGPGCSEAEVGGHRYEVSRLGERVLPRHASSRMITMLRLEGHAEVLDAAGHRLVVGNGFLPSREVTTAAGRVEVTAPRVHDPRDRVSFTSAILPRYMRRSPKVTEVLPILYLRGLSTGTSPRRCGEPGARERGRKARVVLRSDAPRAR